MRHKQAAIKSALATPQRYLEHALYNVSQMIARWPSAILVTPRLHWTGLAWGMLSAILT